MTGEAMFRPTAETDNDGVALTAGTVTIVRQLGADAVDDEVGPMYEVEYPNGLRVHAFGDELTQTEGAST